LKPLWDEALEAFGPERVMIGSDWPVSALYAPYGKTLEVLLKLTADLPAEATTQILEGTAIRAYSQIQHTDGMTPSAPTQQRAPAFGTFRTIALRDSGCVYWILGADARDSFHE
jgi:hypothetical protein